MWPFKRKETIEKRSSGSGYTSQIMAARESYISGRSGIGELTATVQGAITLWEGGLRHLPRCRNTPKRRLVKGLPTLLWAS